MQRYADVGNFADGLEIAEPRFCIDLCGTFAASGIDAPKGVRQTWEGLPAMSTYPPPGPGAGGVGRRIEEAVELIEMELRHTIAYVNDAVIPQVRRESISAMRTVAETLRNLADRIDQAHTPPPNQPKDPRS